MKKYIALLLALVMALSLFAGCAPADGPDETNPFVGGIIESTGVIDTTRDWWGEDDGKTPVKLRFWAAIDPVYGYQKVCDNFNAAYGDRGLTVEYVQYKNDTNGNLSVDTSLTTGEGIDVLISYGNLSRLIPRTEQGLLLNLQPYLKDFDIKAELGEHAADGGVLGEDGSYHGLITTFTNSSFMLINKDMFETAGVEIPYDGWTYSEFLDACEKLTTENTKGICWYCSDINNALTYIRSVVDSNYLYTDETKNESSFKSDLWTNGLNLLKTTMDNGWACDYGECKSEKHGVSHFLQGESAIFGLFSQIRQCMDLANYPHDFVTAFVPCPVPDGAEYEQYKSMAHKSTIGEYVAAAAKTEHPEQCAEFVRWFVQGGMNPTILAGRYPLWVGNDTKDILETVKEMAGNTVDTRSLEFLFNCDRSKLPLGDSSTTLDKKVRTELKNAWEGYLISGAEQKYKSAEEAMQDAYNKAQDILNAATADEKK